MSRYVSPLAVDVRAFAWPLATLERKLHVDAQLAAGELAQVQRQRDTRQAEIVALQGAHERQLRAVTSTRLDPFERRQVLRYLAQEQDELCRQQRQLAVFGVRLAALREARLAAERRLESARKLRAGALSVYTQGQLRRQAKEADLAWLGRLAGKESGASGEREACA
jgi:hypothetical protein